MITASEVSKKPGAVHSDHGRHAIGTRMSVLGVALLLLAGFVAGWHGEAIVRVGARTWGWRVLSAAGVFLVALA